MNKTKKLSTAAVLAITFFVYHIGKDVFKMRIKVGNATRATMAKK